MSENPRALVQANIRLPAGIRDEYQRLATRDGFHYQKLLRDAALMYLSIRKTLNERVWYLLQGAAPAQGKEPGELLAELIESAYGEHAEALFTVRPRARGVGQKP